jgi:uncharacterized Zn finger protein
MFYLIKMYFKYKIGSFRCRHEGHQGSLMTMKDPGDWSSKEPKEWVIRCPRCGTVQHKTVISDDTRKFRG